MASKRTAMVSELERAIATTSGSIQYLQPEDLEPVIVEYLGKIMPLLAFTKVQVAQAKTHEYSRRTAVPASWFEGELTEGTAAGSTYDRPSVQLKILRTWGGVSGFTQATSAKFADALATELKGSIEGMADAIEYAILWANDVDTYQTTGIDSAVIEDTTAKADCIDDLDAVITLTDLDDVIDQVEAFREVDGDAKAFVCSKNMISKISGLQTKIQRTVQAVEFEGGFRMNTYRDIPLVPSSFTKPAGTTTSPAVTATAVTSGGALADDEYFYMVASVTQYGEQIAGTEGSVTISGGGGAGSAYLYWTADANAKLYKIYRGLTTGADNLTLVDIIAAKTYSATGAVSTNVAAWTDAGADTRACTNCHPLEAGEECIFLINFNPDRAYSLLGMVGALGDPVDNLVQYVELATRKDALEYVLQSYLAVKVPWPKLHGIIRRARIAT